MDFNVLSTTQGHLRTNSGHKQIHISKLFSHIYIYIYISTLCQVNLQNQSLCKHKTYIHKHETQIFEEFTGEEGGGGELNTGNCNIHKVVFLSLQQSWLLILFTFPHCHWRDKRQVRARRDRSQTKLYYAHHFSFAGHAFRYTLHIIHEYLLKYQLKTSTPHPKKKKKKKGERTQFF